MPRRRSTTEIAIELEAVRAEWLRAVDVLLAGHELYAATVAGDAGRLSLAMQAFAAAERSAFQMVHTSPRRYSKASIEACIRLADRIGPRRAARVAKVPYRTLSSWRYRASKKVA